MKYLIVCDDCGASQWARGVYEEDTGALIVDDVFEDWEHGGDEFCGHDDFTSVDEESDEPFGED